MKKISILGCGWLGLPLAKSLIGKGYSIKGSTTSFEKISVLEQYGIQAFQIELSETDPEASGKGEINAFLENSEMLIIDIPPKLRGNFNENFVSKIQNLIPFIEKSTVEKILFVSSTSVYADDTSVITEETMPNPVTESGRQLLGAEKLLLTNKNFKTTVVRFGGLIGENRHPIHFLAGRKNLENPDAPINLIHQLDCIGIIETIICNTGLVEVWSEVFNAVAPFHPARKDYYIKKAMQLNLPLPEFETEKKSVGKTILSDKIIDLLGYQFQNLEL